MRGCEVRRKDFVWLGGGMEGRLESDDEEMVDAGLRDGFHSLERADSIYLPVCDELYY